MALNRATLGGLGPLPYFAAQWRLNMRMAPALVAPSPSSEALSARTWRLGPLVPGLLLRNLNFSYHSGNYHIMCVYIYIKEVN